jgi:plastocyanin
MQKVIIGLVVLALIATGAFLITRDSGEEETSNNAGTTNTASPEPATEPQPAEEPQGEATISFNGSEFDPDPLTVPEGTTVTVTNNSSQTIQFDSDPHPQHTDNTELNIETISPGESNTFVANTVGTFGYHNHLNPSQTGTIIVE